jgi:UDP-N-acetylglucosamine 2-epimerase
MFTAHLTENFYAPMETCFVAMRSIVERNSDTELVYPVHLNPQVQEPALRILGGHERIHLIAPADYATFTHLMARATLIVTDSGGIQEEAPTLGKPTLVMRDPAAYAAMARVANPFGDGRAAERIADVIEQYARDRR